MMKKLLHYGANIVEIAISLYLYNILQLFYFYPKRIQLPEKSVVIALITVVFLGFMFWMYKHQLKYENDWNFNQEPHWSAQRLVITIMGFILITLLGTAMTIIVGHGSVSTNQEALDQISKQSGNMFKIMVAFIAPFVEEVIFRGMFFNTFFTKETRMNKWVGIVVSGFVFAYMHDPHITRFILVYWVLGCVLAWVYLRTKDLRYSMLTHMLYNSIGLF